MSCLLCLFTLEPDSQTSTYSNGKRRERHYNAASAGQDLKPIANVESSLATSTRWMFQVLKPLDSGMQGKLGQPQLTRQGKAWREHSTP